MYHTNTCHGKAITHPSGNCSYCWIVLLYQVTVFVNTVLTILQTLYYTICIWTRVALVRKLCRRSKHENTRKETNRHPSTMDHQHTKIEIRRIDVNYNGWQGPCHDKISLSEGSYVADVNRNHIGCIRQNLKCGLSFIPRRSSVWGDAATRTNKRDGTRQCPAWAREDDESNACC